MDPPLKDVQFENIGAGNWHQEDIDKNKKEFENKNDNEINIRKVVKKKTKENYKNDRKLLLSNEELKAISENKMLTDDSIILAQRLFKK